MPLGPPSFYNCSPSSPLPGQATTWVPPSPGSRPDISSASSSSYGDRLPSRQHDNAPSLHSSLLVPSLQINTQRGHYSRLTGEETGSERHSGSPRSHTEEAVRSVCGVYIYRANPRRAASWERLYPHAWPPPPETYGTLPVKLMPQRCSELVTVSPKMGPSAGTNWIMLGGRPASRRMR